MTTSSNPQDGPRKIRIGKFELGVNLLVQIVVLLLLVGMINYWSSRHFQRLDWGRNVNLRLSPQTKAVLDHLAKPVKAIIFFSGAVQEAEQEASMLLREYEYAAKGKLVLEVVDPFQDRARAMELAEKYKFTGSDSIVIFDNDGRSKYVNSSELADMEPRDPMEDMQRRMQGMPPLPPPRMLAFKGEQVMTSAILEVTEAKQNKVYFITGHGEHDYNREQEPSGRTLNDLKQALSRQNFQHAVLNLSGVDKVPEDASAILILGPKQDYSERDISILNEYWGRKGRLLINLPPAGNRLNRLNLWLIDRGITPQNDDVLRVQVAGNEGRIQRAAAFGGNSPILKGLDGQGFESLVPLQSFTIDRNKEKIAQLKITELAGALEGFWGETTPFDSSTPPYFDPKADHKTPLVMGVQVERGASADPSVKLDTARMVVFGSGDMLTDVGIQVGPAALDAAINALNWLMSRENLISLAPKVSQKTTYALTSEQTATIGLWVILYIPLSIGGFGLYYLWWRHGRSLFVLTAWVAGFFLGLTGAWYLLLYSLKHENAKTMPHGLKIALISAAVLGVAAFAMHLMERKNRAAVQK